MARQPFVQRHPFLTLGMVLVVEVVLMATLHLVLGWSLVAIAMVGVVVVILASILLG